MKQVFRTASFNIQHGAWTSFDWNRLVSPLKFLNIDLVGVQEVDMFTSRIGQIDSVCGIREALGCNEGRFIRSMPYAGGDYGNAVFARDAFLSFVTIPLPNGEGQEPRSCGHAILTFDNGRRLHFLNTHLAYESAESRKPQFEILRGILDSIPVEDAYILTGDFNTERIEEFDVLLCGRSALTNELSPKRAADAPHYATFPDTGIAIDNIVYDSLNLSSNASGMIEGRLSDHNLLWAEFALN